MRRLLRTLVLSAAFFVAGGLAIAQEETAIDGIAPAAEEMSVDEELLGSVEQVDPEEFGKRLLTVEEKVNSLKEKVFRSKATLQLLREIVIQGSTTGARAVIWHVNDLGNSYSIQSVSYFLDGQSIYSKTAVDGSLSKSTEFKLHDGAIPAGNHTITVNMVLRGNGFGVFSYVDRYTFNVQSSYAFAAEEGKNCELWIRITERKGIGRSFIERPNVEYDYTCTRTGQPE